MTETTKMSKLTIGVPVFNGERHIGEAIESILSQSYDDFKVIISDNASTDGTKKICEKYAARDQRINYVSQDSNVGAFNNFKYLISQCTTELFVYLAADDRWSSEYLERNVRNLDTNPNAICSVSKIMFTANGKFSHNSNGTYSLDGTIRDNIRNYLLGLPNDNSRYYGVFRSYVIGNAFLGLRPFHAADWYMMLMTLLYGQHVEIGEVLMCREVAEPSRYLNSIRVDNTGFINLVFPLLPMSLALIRKLSVKQFANIVWPLLRINYIKHKEYFSYSRS